MKFKNVFLMSENMEFEDNIIPKGELKKVKLPKELNIYFAHDSDPKKVYGKATNFKYKNGEIYCDVDIKIGKVYMENSVKLGIAAQFSATPVANKLTNIKLNSLILTFTPDSTRSYLW